jgi:hypothetical protein
MTQASNSGTKKYIIYLFGLLTLIVMVDRNVLIWICRFLLVLLVTVYLLRDVIAEVSPYRHPRQLVGGFIRTLLFRSKSEPTTHNYEFVVHPLISAVAFIPADYLMCVRAERIRNLKDFVRKLLLCLLGELAPPLSGY